MPSFSLQWNYKNRCFHFIFPGDFVPRGHQNCTVTARLIVNSSLLHCAINHLLYIIRLKNRAYWQFKCPENLIHK